MNRVMIMLGDSLTASNTWGGAFQAFRVRNLGVGGDTCAGVWARLGKVEEYKPEIIFLTIGTNDFLRGDSAQEIVAWHLRIWAELAEKLPQSRLVVCSIPPYMEKAMPGLPPNLDIMAINYVLAENAAKRSLDFIDLFSLLADSDNQLIPEYTTDGIHLTAPAYRLWENKIKPLLS